MTFCAFILRISAVFVLSIAHCFWWAQVDSSHSPTYCAFILRISAVFVLSIAHCFLVGSSGFEPPTLRLSGARSNHLSYEPVSLYVGGDEGIRTLDPLLAGQVLSQLSYTPVPLYFRSPGLFPLLGSLFSLRFSSSSRAMKTEQQASVPDSVLLLFFCRDSFFSISTSESSTVVMIHVSLERR